MTKPFDVIVAGAGHNSLITTAYLAKAGLRCLVLEANEYIGGDTATVEMGTPGFLHDSCSTAHNLIQASPMLRNNELHLDRYGLEYIHPDPVVHIPFEDGTSITQWQDISRTADEFARFSKRDAATYLEFIEDYKEISPAYGRYRYTPAGLGPSFDELISNGPNPEKWKSRVAASAAEIVLNTFEDPHVQSFMLWMAFMTIQPLRQPGTGILPYSLVFGRQNNSWVLPKGGSGSLPGALAQYIIEHGGEIRTGEKISGLIVENGKCTGVETEKGEQLIATKSVLSTIHIKHLIDMMPKNIYDDTFKSAIEKWEPGIAMFVTHYAVKTPLEFPAQSGTISAVAAGTPGSVERMLRVETDIANNRVTTDDPVLLVLCPTVADKTRAPAGYHTLKVVGFQPYQIDKGPAQWDELKQQIADANLKHLQKFVPTLTSEAIIDQHVKSPLDLERTNSHNWQGACHGGATTQSQSGINRPAPGWSAHRMPLKGLYQTGSTTHPGGSVSGAPGRNAAIVMLQDLGFNPDEIISGKS